ncbi:hypothetical protein BDV96DRAFT_483098 [Lophiotrema nucula]|uniref:HNH domain-containing protein n=1 Tax=Lophiotrema nucula TaxID=690887 RepID=A0A6A5ZUG4_9PLEO|nr:hypothetical protein BDV96DRAFT_483098 [Lophiotrema nucula]
MAERVSAKEQSNFETFRECLSEPVLRALAKPVEKVKKKKRHSKKGSKATNKEKKEHGIVQDTNDAANEEVSDAEDLGEFIDYLATLLFTSLPNDLRGMSYAQFKDSEALHDAYTTPLSATTTTTLLESVSPTAIDSLASYGLLPAEPDMIDLNNFLTPIFGSYLSAVTAPPPIWSSTRTTECELCHREWIPLSYHHLIPKSTHDRVLKRGWHTEDRLNSVAWLCRACHSFVHRSASNEELAKEWYTVELLEQREDVQAWVKWVGRVRWKSR